MKTLSYLTDSMSLSVSRSDINLLLTMLVLSVTVSKRLLPWKKARSADVEAPCFGLVGM